MDTESFPTVLPIFPLAAPLLLPGTVVPLMASEERYRNLLDDALAADGFVGVLQPIFGEADEVGLPGEGPALYQVGCLGRIGECREEGDDGYVALVEGVIRFRIRQEVDGERGYRRMMVDYVEFLDDPETIEQELLDFSELKEVVRQRIEANGSELDLSIMDDMVGTEIVTALAHALPFSSAERQALVETPSLRELQPMLLQLMTVGPGGMLGFDRPPFLPS